MRKSYSVFSHLKEISWGFSGSPVAEPQRPRVSAWSGTRICTPCGRQAGRKERMRRQTGTSPDCFRPSRPRFWTEPPPCLPAPCRPFNHPHTTHQTAFKATFWAVSKLHPHVTSVEPVYRSHDQHFTEVAYRSIYWSFEILKPVSKWRGRGQSGRNDSPEETRLTDHEWTSSNKAVRAWVWQENVYVYMWLKVPRLLGTVIYYFVITVTKSVSKVVS